MKGFAIIPYLRGLTRLSSGSLVDPFIFGLDFEPGPEPVPAQIETLFCLETGAEFSAEARKKNRN